MSRKRITKKQPLDSRIYRLECTRAETNVSEDSLDESFDSVSLPPNQSSFSSQENFFSNPFSKKKMNNFEADREYASSEKYRETSYRSEQYLPSLDYKNHKNEKQYFQCQYSRSPASYRKYSVSEESSLTYTSFDSFQSHDYIKHHRKEQKRYYDCEDRYNGYIESDESESPPMVKKNWKKNGISKNEEHFQKMQNVQKYNEIHSEDSTSSCSDQTENNYNHSDNFRRIKNKKRHSYSQNSHISKRNTDIVENDNYRKSQSSKSSTNNKNSPCLCDIGCETDLELIAKSTQTDPVYIKNITSLEETNLTYIKNSNNTQTNNNDDQTLERDTKNIKKLEGVQSPQSAQIPNNNCDNCTIEKPTNALNEIQKSKNSAGPSTKSTKPNSKDIEDKNYKPNSNENNSVLIETVTATAVLLINSEKNNIERKNTSSRKMPTSDLSSDENEIENFIYQPSYQRVQINGNCKCGEVQGPVSELFLKQIPEKYSIPSTKNNKICCCKCKIKKGCKHTKPDMKDKNYGNYAEK